MNTIHSHIEYFFMYVEDDWKTICKELQRKKIIVIRQRPFLKQMHTIDYCQKGNICPKKFVKIPAKSEVKKH